MEIAAASNKNNAILTGKKGADTGDASASGRADTGGSATENGGNIKVLVKAAAVIDLIASAGTPKSLTALSNELDIAKSTLHGILATLDSIGYISKNIETGEYKLGLRLFELGNIISRKLDERRIAEPYMQMLAEKTGETVHLSVLEDGEVLYINKVESSHSIRIITESGLRLPVHCSALGKALLSGKNNDEILAILKKKGMAKFTETTITEPDGFIAEIEAVRRKGYASDKQEFMVGLRCVAAPIYDINGKVICALSISGPISRMSGELLEVKRKHMTKAAISISRKLGYKDGEK
jgi:DNA-binding IclR family transcriptional regulator